VQVGSGTPVSMHPDQIDHAEHACQVIFEKFHVGVALQWVPYAGGGAAPPSCQLPLVPEQCPPPGPPHPLAPLQRGSRGTRECKGCPRQALGGGETGLAVCLVAFPEFWEVLQAVLLGIRGDP